MRIDRGDVEDHQRRALVLPGVAVDAALDGQRHRASISSSLTSQGPVGQAPGKFLPGNNRPRLISRTLLEGDAREAITGYGFGSFPGPDSLTEGDSVYGLQGGVEGKAKGRAQRTELRQHPDRPVQFSQDQEQRGEARVHQNHGGELGRMNPRPGRILRVDVEGLGVVIGLAAGVQQRHADMAELTRKCPGGGGAQQVACGNGTCRQCALLVNRHRGSRRQSAIIGRRGAIE